MSTQLVLKTDLTFPTLSLSIFCFLIIFKTFHCPKLVSEKGSAVKRSLISFFTRPRHVSMILKHGCKRTLKVITVFQVNLSWNFSGWEQNFLFRNFKKFRPKTFSGLLLTIIYGSPKVPLVWCKIFIILCKNFDV